MAKEPQTGDSSTTTATTEHARQSLDRLKDAGDALVCVADRFLNPPEGASGRPMINTLQVAVENYMNVRKTQLAAVPHRDVTYAPFTAIEEKIDRMSWVLMRLVNNLNLPATLTCYGKFEDWAIPGGKDVRINVFGDSFSNRDVADLSHFADRHGLELEFSREHGVTLRLPSDWSNVPEEPEAYVGDYGPKVDQHP